MSKSLEIFKIWYAAAVLKAGVIVGPVPRKISTLCFIFVRNGGSISSTRTGSRCYSYDLEWRYCAHCDFTVMTVKKMRNIPNLLKQIPKDGAFTQHDAKDEEKDLMDAQPIKHLWIVIEKYEKMLKPVMSIL